MKEYRQKSNAEIRLEQRIYARIIIIKTAKPPDFDVIRKVLLQTQNQYVFGVFIALKEFGLVIITIVLAFISKRDLLQVPIQVGNHVDTNK